VKNVESVQNIEVLAGIVIPLNPAEKIKSSLENLHVPVPIAVVTGVSASAESPIIAPVFVFLLLYLPVAASL